MKFGETTEYRKEYLQECSSKLDFNSIWMLGYLYKKHVESRTQ